MKMSFDNAWQEWIETNIKRDCNLNEMSSILVANDFCPELIKNQLHLDKKKLLKVSPIVDTSHVSTNIGLKSLHRPTDIIDSEKDIYLANAKKIDTADKLALF
jgi:hypothetical protein